MISGLSSGFDWRSMIDQVIEIDHRKVDLVESQKSEYESKLSEWQSFNTQLLSLKTSARAIADPEDFDLFSTAMSTDSATVGADDLLSVSADENAAPGTYTVKVTNLAAAEKLSSNPFTSKTAELGASYAGDIMINGRVITFSSTDSLEDAAFRINNANTGDDPSGVTAGIINYGTGDFRLVLTSDDTGEDGMDIVNGSSTDLVQKFGWKDSEAAVIKNAITNGAQSDTFSAANVAVKSLVGLSTGEASTGTLTLDGSAVTIDLSTDSLTDIKTAINDASIAGVTASVVAQTEGTDTVYRLQIDGTQTFVDENNILNTLGIQDHTSSDVTGKVSENTMTADGTNITADTLLTDIDGYNTFTSGGASGGDYITLTGSDTGGSDIGSVDFDISGATTVQDLLDQIETSYGDVIAYVTDSGTLRVDDLTGGANLSVTLTDQINDGNSQLEFMTGDAVFSDASARERQIVAGEDASVTIDGTQVTSSTNVIDDVIAGLTLNLEKEDAATNINLSVDRDVSSIQGKIQSFADEYNAAMTYINSQFSYDEDAEETGGVLFGDGTLRSVKSDLTSLLTETIWGVNTDFSTLGLAGITMDNDLQLSIGDELTGYLQTNFNDIKALFTGQGSTSSGNLTYIDHSRETQAGEYTVHIDTAATQGSQTGTTDLSSGGATDTLTITRGDRTADISITTGMDIDDIVNEINTELDAEYTQTIVGDELLYSDASQTSAITSETTWDTVYDSTGNKLGFSDSDTISYSGTARNGSEVSGSYTISSTASDTVQGLLSAIENSFSNNATASIDSSGRIVVADKYDGSSQVAVSSINHAAEGEFFGAVDVTDGAGDGSSQGRYAIAVSASDDGAGQLVLTNDDFGSSSFTISQAAGGQLGLTDGDVTGLDVAGTINGEAATGSGQRLSGDDGNANTDGLSITYTGTSSDVDAGTVKVTLGVAELFDRALFSITDSIDGYVAFKQDSLQNSIDSFDTRIEQMEDRLDQKTETMIDRFVAMEQALSRIQSQSDWLAGQLDAASQGWG